MIKKVLSLFLLLVLVLNVCPVLAEENYVTISIEKFTIGQGYILSPNRVLFSKGETLANVLIRVWGEDNFKTSPYGFYLSAVKDSETSPVNIPNYILENSDLKKEAVSEKAKSEWLSECDYTNMSGWMYTLNNQQALSMDSVILKSGDVVRIQFSLYGWGADIGLGFDGNYIECANKDRLTEKIAEIKNNYEFFTNEGKEKYNNALEILCNMESTQEMVDVALTNISDLELVSTTYIPEKENVDVLKVLDNTLNIFVKNPPVIGTVGGEWAILALSRSSKDNLDEYFDEYYKALSKHVIENEGVLSKVKCTEYARTTLALVSISRDPRYVAGFDLLNPLLSFEKVSNQGINGVTFGLIALNSWNFEADKTKYLEYLKGREKEGGGFALSADSKADVDITAQVLAALSPYKNSNEMKPIIERSIIFLEKNQLENGGFKDSNGEFNAESTAQVIIALSSLGINATEDPRFIKSGGTPLSALVSLYIENEGFVHILGGKPDMIATEQSACALVSYERLVNRLTPLYDMSDIKNIEGDKEVVPTEDPEPKIIEFMDTKGHWAEKTIGYLTGKGIINGVSKTEFCPDKNLTRAEFSKIMVQALNLKEDAGANFQDVSKEAWYFKYIGTAFKNGLINGIDNKNFAPNSFITREQTAVITERAAKLMGTNTNVAGEEIDFLSGFLDYTTCSDYSKSALAFCVKEGIYSDKELYIRPHDNITRAEVATIIERFIKNFSN